MDHLENEMLSKWAVQPWLWWRYIDDIFFIWTKSEKELDEFMTHMNSYHPNIRFTYEKSQDKINFLDMTVYKTNGRLLTDLYCKPTDGHQYLHSKSCHPFHLADHPCHLSCHPYHPLIIPLSPSSSLLVNYRCRSLL